MLAELPQPPAGKTGWPWTEETPPLPELTPEGSEWPRISLITPNYNRAAFLEESIRAVLLQSYPNLEYLIIDGASTDGSLDIIRRYERWITSWTSEPDSGPSQAINRGLERVTGSLFGLALSDDRLYPDALRSFGEAHAESPDRVLAGDITVFHDDGGQEELFRQEGLEFANVVQFWRGGMRFLTPGLFFPTSVVDTVGGFDETLLCDDYDFLCRVLAIRSVRYLHRPVAAFRVHPGSRTSGDTADLTWFDLSSISRRYWKQLPAVDLAGYRRSLSDRFFCIGIRRLLRGRSQALRFLSEGFRIHPAWSLYSGTRMLYGCVARRFRAISRQPSAISKGRARPH